MKNSFKFLTLVILFFITNCANSYNGKYKKEFELLKKAWDNNDDKSYYNIMYDLVMKSDSLEGRKALIYYFFEFPYNNDTYLYKIQDVVKKFGFYEDWEVLDRFYERYREKYSREALARDSSLISEHQAYIQFLAVCNYEKIKPLYLQELSETIREGDYTYAFNSYLLPEHWEEAADTLMKYYWDVKDKDTRMRMNEAILKLKGNKGKEHYISIIRKEPYEISRTFFMQFESDTTMLKEYLPYVQDAKLKFILEKYLSLRRGFAKEKK